MQVPRLRMQTSNKHAVYVGKLLHYAGSRHGVSYMSQAASVKSVLCELQPARLSVCGVC